MPEQHVGSMMFNKELNGNKRDIKLFSKLQEKRRNISADIKFIRLCIANDVTPNFVRRIVKFDNNSAAQKSACKKVLESEKCKHYSTLNNIELQLYNLHLKLTKSIGNVLWVNFEDNLFSSLNGKMRKKTINLKNKFDKLCKRKGTKPKPKSKKNIQENVVNLSKITFTNTEKSLLNQGSKNCVQYSNKIEDYIVDIQIATAELNETDKTLIKSKCVEVLEEVKNFKVPYNPHSRVIKSLKEKQEQIIYTKSDKGNMTVILDKDDYANRMENMLRGEDYIKIKTDPLRKCTNKVNKIIKESKIVPDNQKHTIKTNNPILPRMYGLPKIHKPGSTMRPIINNIGAPTYKLANWLLNKFRSFKSFDSLSLRNSYDLLDQIQNIEIGKDDTLVSFDVTAMFPNIPRQKLMKVLEQWLNTIGLQKYEIDEYIKLTEICIEQSFFTFNQQFYQQKSGLSMGNPLSPFLADLYMSAFEIKITRAFPHIFKIWHRYVDDIFAIVPHKQITDAIKLLNLQEKTIKFTMEIEKDGYLPFLDLKVKKQGNQLKFGIYRKPTHTDNYIRNNSYNPRQHKIAVFNSLTYRLVHIPMDTDEYKKEYTHIIQIAKLNGYDKKLIDKKIRKFRKQKERQQNCTLQEINKEIKYKKFTFHPKFHHKFNKIFQKHNLKLAPKNRFSIKNLLNFHQTDIIPMESKSGIYQINCNECDQIYIGQTKRNVKTRVKEHFRNLRNGEVEKSAVAAHFWQTRHEINAKPRLLKNATSKHELAAWENIWILRKKEKAMNFEIPPGDLLTRKFIMRPPEGGSNTTTTSTGSR